MTRLFGPVLFALVLAAAQQPATAPAQEPAQETGAPFLLINQERLLTGSRAGQALLTEEEEARERLRAEAREIDRRFEEEERRLTETRASMDAEEFRTLSDAFDERVVRARREQDARSNALVMEFDQRRRQFYSDVAPILVGLLSRFDARAILDESTVLLADQSLNITDAVIAEIDARFEAAEPEGEPEPEGEAAPGNGSGAAPPAQE